MKKEEVKSKMKPEHKKFLDALRDSGTINMFEAGRYISKRFNLSLKNSHDILNEWMSTFDGRN